jgi:SP family arabinose:H+ symporter-like MFS transporter
VTGVAALVTGLEYGFTLAIIAGAEPFISDRFELTSRQLGLVVSNLDLGAALGAVLAGPLSDRFGRRRALLATAVIFILSAAMSALATHVIALLVGRLLGGMAVGAAMIMPLYVAEISPAKARGLLVSLVQIGIVTGILAAFCTAWCTVDAGPTNWRWMFAMGIVPGLALLVTTSALPESPRWLISQGKSGKARDTLASLMGEAEARLELQSVAQIEPAHHASWRALLRRPMRTALLIGLVLTALSVSVGINAVIFYGPLILIEGAGQDVSAALLGAVALGLVNLVFSLVALFTIDVIGRKPLLLGGLAGMGLAMLLLGALFRNAAVESPSGVLVSILVFIAFYAVSLGPITWVLVSEIFPTATRGVGMAICIVIMYLADFAVTFAFPILMERIGNGVFYLFSGVCAAGIAFVLLRVPETKGKTLEQIEAMWGARDQKPVAPATQTSRRSRHD